MATETVTYSKNGREVKVVTLMPNTPIIGAYSHFALPHTKALMSATKDLIIENVTVDERRAAPTGKQFATADIMCCDDGTIKLLIPPVEYNVIGSCSLTSDELPDCGDESAIAVEGKNKELRVQAMLYGGVLNRNAQIGMNILVTGKLEAHNSSFDFGSSHISVATEKYGDAGFDVIEFIGDTLMDGNYDKVSISSADIKAFNSSIGTNADDSLKGYRKADSKSGTLAENGVILLGYHEDTNTPIYAVQATVVDNVRDETTGKVVSANIELLPKGVMVFTNGKPIHHKFGALQIEKNGASYPRKMKFRQFRETDLGTQLTSGRIQTNLTPFVASFTNVKVVKELS